MEKSIQYYSQPVFYTIQGQGDPVVLLHGLAEESSIWEQQARFLSGAYKLIIPDLPGSGRSPLPGHLTLESLAGAVKAILDAEGIEKTVLIGHSMGGYVTMAFAELYPQMIRAIGLFHSTAYADSDEKKAARKRNNEFITGHGTLELLKQSVPALFSNDFKTAHPEIIKELIDRNKGFDPLAIVAYNNAMMERPDRSHLLEGASFPFLFIIGRQDGTLSFQQSLKLAHIPDKAYIHVLEKTGHMGLIEEADKSNEVLKKFLEDMYMH